MLAYKIELDYSKFKKKTEGMIDRCDDLKPQMEMIAQDMLKQVQLNFRNESDPDGMKWIPSKRVEKHGGKTLQLRKELLRSMNRQADREIAAVGTNKDYARVHQFGGEVQTKRMSRYVSYKVKKNGQIRFSKNKKINSKRNYRVEIRAYGIRIPQRRYVGITQERARVYTKSIARYIISGKPNMPRK